MDLKYRLLIVDDDPQVRSTIAEVLSSRFNVSTASTGDDGLKQAQSSQPDAIILDIQMPGRDGINVCKALQEDERTNSIPVLMLTAVEDDSQRAEALIAGASDLVSKPVRPRELFVRVLRMLLRAAKGGRARRLCA